ncbi:short-chain dehydrogenase [Pluteus cervinus]|uniref:Short-chain dehydrogenase n=1 Tax=Pluteus cervinus TaxID=181527 RepID=A0ACD3AB80_9AGAR|nr:short-chain dehydrogenase [Pluteus cervinus]
MGFLDNIFRLFRDQLFTTPPPLVRADLSGKTVLVVGANVGLGFEAAKHFAEMQPERLILACRSETKGQEAINLIKEQTGFQAELWLLDLAKFSSVRKFADRWEKEGGRLDILVENAAVSGFEYNQTEDGWETMLHVNYLASALHALLLLPHMIETAKKYSTTPRLVTVSSGTNHWIQFDKEILGSSSILKSLNSYDPALASSSTRSMRGRYPLTKLLNIFFTRALNDRLSTSHPTIITNAVDPAFCHSLLRRDIRSFGISLVEFIFAFPTEVGSRQLVFGAIGEDEKLRGGYVSFSKVVEPNEFISTGEGREAQERLWRETIDVFQKLDPRVQNIVRDHLSN